MFLLQAYYEIKKELQKSSSYAHPDLTIIRKALFWDSDIATLDWEKKHKTIIRRVFERGNNDEKEEIIRFYGADKIKAVVGSSDIKNVNLPNMGHLKRK